MTHMTSEFHSKSKIYMFLKHESQTTVSSKFQQDVNNWYVFMSNKSLLKQWLPTFYCGDS